MIRKYTQSQASNLSRTRTSLHLKHPITHRSKNFDVIPGCIPPASLPPLPSFNCRTTCFSPPTFLPDYNSGAPPPLSLQGKSYSSSKIRQNEVSALLSIHPLSSSTRHLILSKKLPTNIRNHYFVAPTLIQPPIPRLTKHAKKTSSNTRQSTTHNKVACGFDRCIYTCDEIESEGIPP